jgi:hypothetical protein
MAEIQKPKGESVTEPTIRKEQPSARIVAEDTIKESLGAVNTAPASLRKMIEEIRVKDQGINRTRDLIMKTLELSVNYEILRDLSFASALEEVATSPVRYIKSLLSASDEVERNNMRAWLMLHSDKAAMSVAETCLASTKEQIEEDQTTEVRMIYMNRLSSMRADKKVLKIIGKTDDEIPGIIKVHNRAMNPELEASFVDHNIEYQLMLVKKMEEFSKRLEGTVTTTN